MKLIIEIFFRYINMKNQNQLISPNQPKISTKGVFTVLVFAMLMSSMSWKAKAQTIYTWIGTTSSAWATPTNWSPNGNPGAAAGDIVFIPTVTNQPTVTVAPANALASLTFTSTTAATLTINGVTLTVTGEVTLNTSSSANTAATIAGTGTLTCGSLNAGSTTGTTALTTATTSLTSSIASLNVSNQISIISNYSSSPVASNNASFTQSGTTVTAAGITTTNTNVANTSSYTISGSSLTLNLNGASSITSTGTSTLTLDATGATVNYTGAAQTVLNVNYANLGLSGSGTKTLGATTISSNLSISETAVASLTGNSSAGNLTLAGSGRANGTWGSTSSSATNQNNTYFSSTGTVNVANDRSAFITRWDLAIAGSGATQLSIGTATSGTVNYYWQEVSPGSASGSGSFSGANLTITGLPAGATIRLGIYPSNFQRVKIDNGTDKNRLLDVEQWGSTVWLNMEKAFFGCNNLNVSATDIPVLTSCALLFFMFAECNSLNGPSNINSWNTAAVTNMGYMFYQCYAFNQNIGSWNTGNVTQMYYMFAVASAFNNGGSNSINNWNTGAVTDMSMMFFLASSFNQNIGSWNTGAVTNMLFLFNAASAFNNGGSTSINNWNTAAVTDMYEMFSGASAFNQNIGNWNLKANVDLNNMLDNCGMNSTNYSATLVGWNANVNCPTSITLGAIGMTYNSSAIAARTNLLLATGSGGKGWTITGDALAANNWTGVTSNFWDVATNWSLGIVPSGNGDIIISSGTPILNIDLTVQSGKSLLLSGSGTMAIEAGKSLSIALGGNVDFGNNLVTLKSDTTGTAAIGTVAGTLNNASNLTVERYIPANGRRYRFLASPVVGGTSLQWRDNVGSTSGRGIQITGPTGTVDSSTNNAKSAFYYDETNTTGTINDAAKWPSIDGNTTLTNGQGYRVFVRGDRTISLTTLNTTNNATTIWVNGAYPTGTRTLPVSYTSSGGQGWNLVGNPYPCSIDWNASGWTKTNINDQIAIYRPSTNSYAYYTTTGNASVNNGSNIIGSGQAFWVRANASSPELKCTETVKTISTPTTLLLKTTPSNQLRIKLTQDSTNIDETLIVFGENYKDEFTETEDIGKLANTAVNISSVVGVEQYAAINFNSNNYAEKTFPLSVWGNKNGAYQLDLTQVSGFDAAVSIYLRDKYLNVTTAIDHDKTLNINLTDNSKGDNRFELIFKNSATNTEDILLPNAQLSIYPNPATNLLNVNISNAKFKNSSVTIYNVSGQQLMNSNMIGTNTALNIEDLSNGVYFINVSNEIGFNKTVKFVK